MRGERRGSESTVRRRKRRDEISGYTVLRLRTASHAYKEYLQTDYDTDSVRNGPGLSRDNPLCLLFKFTLFSDRFSEVPDSCTVLRYQMVDGSASEALQARVQYRRHQWLMGALLKCSRPMNSTWRCTPLLCTVQETFTLLCTVHSAPHRS